jgi:hypothetical protein
VTDDLGRNGAGPDDDDDDEEGKGEEETQQNEIDDDMTQGGTGDDDIIEGEIVDEVPAERSSGVGPEPLPDPDAILVPCHHGCTCGLHMQTTYGSRVPRHKPYVLDHGEMGLLTEAAERAARRGDDYHAYLSRRRDLCEQAYGRASKQLTQLEVMLTDRDGRRAERDDLAEQRAALPPDRREPAPRWLKATAVGSALAIAAFDAYFFQQAFLNILQIPPRQPWWKENIGVVAALVFAVGVIATGRMLAGPIWRLSGRWRHPASPDDEPPGRLRVTIRALLTVAPAAAILTVLGVWALVRAQDAATGGAGTVDAGPVMLLLLSLALTVIVLEVLVYNPYQAALTRDKREVRKLLKADREATDALTVHDMAWRNLRSSQDEVISSVRAELARPWHTVILPARLRHGRAGPEPVPPEYGVAVRVIPIPPVREGSVGLDQVEITYQLFSGVAQPQPSPGPLAETVRSVMELHPGALRARHYDLQERLRALIGEAPVAEAAS